MIVGGVILAIHDRRDIKQWFRLDLDRPSKR